MELQTVSQVSKTFGISAQMLRYYERSGLITSLRKDDYAYRVYDYENIERIQQIIILRKLQIPVKQICVILNNPDAATAIDIFKSNISELQNEIAALETIKSALEIFVSKIEEIAAVRLNLNLLTDDSVVKLAKSLSLIQKNVKENKTMDELNRASETLDKAKEKFVRIVYQSSMTMACIDIKTDKEKAYADIKKFITDTNLLKIKPDIRFFTWTHGFSVTIPDDFDVPSPFVKKTYIGGLCASIREDEWQFLIKWIKYSDLYDRDHDRPTLDEFINAFNVYKLKDMDSDTFGNNVESFAAIKRIRKPVPLFPTRRFSAYIIWLRRCFLFSPSRPQRVWCRLPCSHGL